MVSTVFALDKLHDNEIKAAFVYNFIKIVKPVKPLGDYYHLCIVGESSIQKFLPELSKQNAHGLAIKTIEMEVNGDFSICDSLFLGQVENHKIANNLLQHAEKNNVLTISDVDLKEGTDVIFYIKQLQGKLRFDVSLILARQAQFQLDANLLRLAHIVKE